MKGQVAEAPNGGRAEACEIVPLHAAMLEAEAEDGEMRFDRSNVLMIVPMRDTSALWSNEKGSSDVQILVQADR